MSKEQYTATLRSRAPIRFSARAIAARAVLRCCAAMAIVGVAFPTPVRALNILPLGDSITEGLCSDASAGTCTNPHTGDPHTPGTNAYYFANFNAGTFDFCGTFAKQMVENTNLQATGGYRGPLLLRLRATGLAVNYKGHVVSGIGIPAVADRKHEGHGGWGTQHIGYCLNDYMAAQTPDTVLLDIGANNLLGGEPPATVANNVIALKQQAENRTPKPRVLTALLSPGFNLIVSDYAARTQQVNLAIAQQSGRDFPCTARDLADMSVLTASDLTSDSSGARLHPNTAGYAKMAEIWSDAIVTPECKFDSRAFVTIGGTLVESITAYGRYWNFDGSHWLGNGALPTVSRYASICSGHAVCRFDTRTFLPSASGPQESITAFNAYWTFSNAGALAASGTLRSVPRYNQYICALSGGPSTCAFDTRTTIDRTSGTVEAITAYGHFFEFNLATGALITSGTLASTSRYATICANKPASETYCTFDTRTYVQLPGIPYVESITAYGRYWNFDATSGALLDSGQLKNIHGTYYP